MSIEDRELIHLREAERSARGLFERVRRYSIDAEVIQHANDLMIEAEAALARYIKAKLPP